MRRDGDDGDRARGRIRLQDARGLPPVDQRNGDVHEDQVGRQLPRALDAFGARYRLGDLVSRVAQEARVYDPVVLVVFDEQHGLRGVIAHALRTLDAGLNGATEHLCRAPNLSRLWRAREGGTRPTPRGWRALPTRRPVPHR